VTPALDPRFQYSLVGLAAMLVLGFGLPRFIAPLAPRIGLVPVARPLTHLLLLVIALAGAVLVLAGVDTWASPGPFAFVPFAIGRDLFGSLALAGSILLALGARRRSASADGLSDARTWLAAGVLFLVLYGAIGVLLLPFVDVFPAPHRLPWALVASALVLPYFGATETLLRGAGRTGLWLPAVGKLVTLVVVGAAAFSGLLSFIIALALPAIALFFAFFELVAIRIGRCMPGPWIAALFQAGFTGFALAAIFPYTG
jgi:hypothetical protein